jgi:hypothetical protein
MAVHKDCYAPIGLIQQGGPRRRETKQVGDPNHIKVFAKQDVAETWFVENDREGFAFEYEAIGPE